VCEEIKSTARLLNDAILNEDQARRLLTATGELAQLAAWVAADMGQYQEAESYVQNGVIASHAASNLPLAANIISTLSYQLANTGKPRQASILARTAYAGARHTASATTKALLLERVAWADAKVGDLNSCDRSLGLVDENFSKSDPENDPDWVYWLSKEEIDVMAGRCFTELGQPEKAIPLLRSSIEKYDSTHIREISLYQSWLAEDYVLLKDIRTAADLALEVLALGRLANSARTDERLHHLAASLQEYKSIQNVAEFLDQHKAYMQK
jgi:tetratricopeptide (TPR) repeat protein